MFYPLRKATAVKLDALLPSILDRARWAGRAVPGEPRPLERERLRLSGDASPYLWGLIVARVPRCALQPLALHVLAAAIFNEAFKGKV